MQTNAIIHPDVTRLQILMIQRHVGAIEVLSKAKVSRNTWWRMRNGKDFRMSKLTDIESAINQLTQEQTNGETQVQD